MATRRVRTLAVRLTDEGWGKFKGTYKAEVPIIKSSALWRYSKDGLCGGLKIQRCMVRYLLPPQ